MESHVPFYNLFPQPDSVWADSLLEYLGYLHLLGHRHFCGGTDHIQEDAEKLYFVHLMIGV